MRALRFIRRFLLFCLLTLLTQVGGLIYLLNRFTYRFIEKKFSGVWIQRSAKMLSFITLYCLSTLFVVPILAKPFGRVPLPYTEINYLQPLNVLTCLLNRHYVQPELREAAYNVAIHINDNYPGTYINYLDGNFPFFDKFPLIPHLSHNDGEKLDLSFCYNDSNTGLPANTAPSFIGYGICEEPTAGEVKTAQLCADKGYWNYSMMLHIIPQGNKKNFTFNAEKTRELVNLFAAEPAIGKIFIEPHLKERLQLTSPKIRFHGCRAVRHDDHLHVQLN